MLSQGVLYFLIVDPDTSIASFNPAELFDLSDSSIPASWKFGSYDDDQGGTRMIWGYPLLVEDEAHAGALEDRDVNAISAFLREKSKIDQEYGVPA